MTAVTTATCRAPRATTSPTPGVRRSPTLSPRCTPYGDGWGELIVGTQGGVQIFGTPASNQIAWRELWRSPYLESVTVTAPKLYLGDLDGDGQGEVLAGLKEGQIYVLSGEGEILQSIDLGDAPLLAVSALVAWGRRPRAKALFARSRAESR